MNGHFNRVEEGVKTFHVHWPVRSSRTATEYIQYVSQFLFTFWIGLIQIWRYPIPCACVSLCWHDVYPNRVTLTMRYKSSLNPLRLRDRWDSSLASDKSANLLASRSPVHTSAHGSTLLSIYQRDKITRQKVRKQLRVTCTTLVKSFLTPPPLLKLIASYWGHWVHMTVKVKEVGEHRPGPLLFGKWLNI